MAVQVDEQLPIGIAVGDRMGHLKRQRGLTNPGHAVDRDDQRSTRVMLGHH
jgi:hypothetical protein